MIRIDRFPFRTLVLVYENERVIVLRNGRFHAVLGPGRYRFSRLFTDVTVEEHHLGDPVFRSGFAQDLMRSHRDLLARHVTEVVTGPEEVAVLFRDGRVHAVQAPDSRTLLWTEAGPWSVERIAAADSLEIAAPLARRLAAGSFDAVRRFNVEAGQTGLLYVDNVFVRLLDPGSHAFWNIGRPVQVKIVDVREHALDLSGQEILTRDRVSLRINLAARYRVTDPVAAVSATKDFADTLYRALQHALRQSLTTRTLDALLADRVSIDDGAAETVRTQMAALGIAVGEITIKDVILPGEMRDILNRVVQAEKEAEANVIRRREETAATRSLLNTARVMEENPVMLRLKELEALERIAEKVQTLVVHNGARGLLRDLVTLGPDTPAEARAKELAS